jgi:hypothetical protein
MSRVKKSERDAADAQPAPGGGDTEARQHKARIEISDLLLKHPNATLATYV